MFRNLLTPTTFFVTTLTFISTAAVAQGQAQPDADVMNNMGHQMAKFGGSMHVIGKICGSATEQQLSESKQKQQEMLQQRGMGKAEFEKIYSAAVNETQEKFNQYSKDEQQAACDDIERKIKGG